MRIYSISKESTGVIKGFAIFCIVFHNFFHWLNPSPGENEFDFAAERIFNFFSQIGAKPLEFINIVFSYFGHFGVQLFLFISGYGLALSMLKKSRTWGTFVFGRLRKIYPLLLTGIVFGFFSWILLRNNLFTIGEWKELLYKMLFIHTLLPNSGLSMNGPWWFFGLIVQLYILFPLLYQSIQKYNSIALGCVCLIAYTWIYISQYLFQDFTEIPLMENAPGHIVEFTFGIWFACNKDRKISPLLLVLAIVVFILGNFYKVLYPFTFISVVLIFIYCFRTPNPESKVFKFFSYIGALSMVLFATHSLFRDPFIALAQGSSSALFHLFVAILFFSFSVGIAYVGKKVLHFISVPFDAIPHEFSLKWHILSTICKILLIALSLCIIVFYISYIGSSKQVLAVTEITTAGTVLSDEKYETFATFEIPQFTHTITTDITITAINSSQLLPCIVIQIPGKLWQKIDLNNCGFTEKDNKKNYTITQQSNCSFVQSFSKQKLQVYFYNPNGGNIDYTDVNVSITVR